MFTTSNTRHTGTSAIDKCVSSRHRRELLSEMLKLALSTPRSQVAKLEKHRPISTVHIKLQRFRPNVNRVDVQVKHSGHLPISASTVTTYPMLRVSANYPYCETSGDLGDTAAYEYINCVDMDRVKTLQILKRIRQVPTYTQW